MSTERKAPEAQDRQRSVSLQQAAAAIFGIDVVDGARLHAPTVKPARSRTRGDQQQG